MPQDLVIRESSPADLAAITDIYAHAVRFGLGTFEIDPPDRAEMARRREYLLKDGYPHLVAECAGRVAGYCYAGIYRTRPAYRFSVEDSVYVDEHFRGRKIGLGLLNELMARCTARHFRLIVAVIGDTGNTASIRLHAAAGFQHAGTLPNIGWKANRWLDTVLMTRALGRGAAEPPQTH